MLAFQEVNDYTTFKAEFAMEAGDMIFHFYKTPEIRSLPNPRGYWAEVFPSVLEPVAKKAFDADYPRLKAQHVYDEEQPHSPTEPLDSWWFRAYGFGHRLDPHSVAYRFLDALDAALDEAIVKLRQ